MVGGTEGGRGDCFVGVSEGLFRALLPPPTSLGGNAAFDEANQMSWNCVVVWNIKGEVGFAVCLFVCWPNVSLEWDADLRDSFFVILIFAVAQSRKKRYVLVFSSYRAPPELPHFWGWGGGEKE